MFAQAPKTEADVISGLHPAALDPERLLAQCTVRRGRRCGPGGQHRNKVETAVVILHEPTAVRGEASERRSQEENRRAALFRLRKNLALTVRLPRAASNEPSRLWRTRCRDGRVSVCATHQDFPALLAEALDVLTACGTDMKAAATALGVTPSQLAKFLKQEPQAMKQVNERRGELGLRPLR
jgi:hypothetical protein